MDGLDTLRTKLADLRRLVRLAAAGAGLGRLMLRLALVAAGSFALDRAFELPYAGRAALLYLGAAALAWWTGRLVLRPLLRPLPDAALALEVEERLPQSGDVLASALAFGAPGSGSATLRAGVVRRAEGVARALRPAELVRWQAARRRLGVGLVALVVTAGAALAGPAQAALWFRRDVLLQQVELAEGHAARAGGLPRPGALRAARGGRRHPRPRRGTRPARCSPGPDGRAERRLAHHRHGARRLRRVHGRHPRSRRQQHLLRPRRRRPRALAPAGGGRPAGRGRRPDGGPAAGLHLRHSRSSWRGTPTPSTSPPAAASASRSSARARSRPPTAGSTTAAAADGAVRPEHREHGVRRRPRRRLRVHAHRQPWHRHGRAAPHPGARRAGPAARAARDRVRRGGDGRGDRAPAAARLGDGRLRRDERPARPPLRDRAGRDRPAADRVAAGRQRAGVRRGPRPRPGAARPGAGRAAGPHRARDRQPPAPAAERRRLAAAELSHRDRAGIALHAARPPAGPAPRPGGRDRPRARHRLPAARATCAPARTSPR